MPLERFGRLADAEGRGEGRKRKREEEKEKACFYMKEAPDWAEIWPRDS